MSDIVTADEIAASYFQHIQKAQLLLEVERWREALVELGKHLARFPEDYFALCSSALCHLNLREFQIAYDLTKRAIAAAPDDEWAYRLQSVIFTENGEPGRALSAAQTAVEKEPDNPDAIQCLFWAQASYGSLDDAESTLKLLMEARHDTAESHEAAGYLALQKEQMIEAERHYLNALEIDPESVNALNNLGVVYLNLAQSGKGRHYKQKSVEMFERAVRVEPTFKKRSREYLDGC